MSPQQPVGSPFGHGSTAAEVVADVDLSGRTAVVTGAASGIGVETALALAGAGAALVLPVRNRAKGETVAAELRADTGNDAIEVADADLFDLDSVQAFVADFLARDTPLDIVIDNAGIMAGPLQRSPQGWESQFATNHLGHFALTVGLAPALRAADGARVVVLSSTAHRRNGLDLDDPHFETRDYDKWEAYGQAKSANALFALGLDDRMATDGVRAFSVHPGGIMTGLQKDLSREEMDAMGWLDADGNPIQGFKSVEQGAATAVWAATSPLLEGEGGLYCEDCEVASPATADFPFVGVHPHVRDRDTADGLWALSEDLTGVRL